MSLHDSRVRILASYLPVRPAQWVSRRQAMPEANNMGRAPGATESAAEGAVEGTGAGVCGCGNGTAAAAVIGGEACLIQQQEVHGSLEQPARRGLLRWRSSAVVVARTGLQELQEAPVPCEQRAAVRVGEDPAGV